MSNEIYGFIESSNIKNKGVFFKNLEEKSIVGISEISFSELYNFPEELIPKNKETNIAFIIGDGKGVKNATYLLDDKDYSPDSKIGLPLEGKYRRKILIDFFKIIIDLSETRKFVVAICDSSQIEEIKSIRFCEMEKIIAMDMENSSPPDCLYHIS